MVMLWNKCIKKLKTFFTSRQVKKLEADVEIYVSAKEFVFTDSRIPSITLGACAIYRNGKLSNHFVSNSQKHNAYRLAFNNVYTALAGLAFTMVKKVVVITDLPYFYDYILEPSMSKENQEIVEGIRLGLSRFDETHVFVSRIGFNKKLRKLVLQIQKQQEDYKKWAEKKGATS